MTKNRLIFSLLICVIACIYPSLANDSSATTGAPSLPIRFGSDNGASLTSSASQAAPSAVDTGQANSSTIGKNSHATKSSLPKKAFSIATAFFIGTPVCVVRRSKYEERYGVHGMIGDSESKCKKILAGAFWLPFAVVTGTLEAPFDATANGLMYPAFSKDQLSQGKLIQNN